MGDNLVPIANFDQRNVRLLRKIFITDFPMLSPIEVGTELACGGLPASSEGAWY